MTSNTESRVITRLRHGAHAVVDAAPGVAAALRAGSVRLSDVTQNDAVAKAADREAALAAAGVTDFHYLLPELVDDPANLLPADTADVTANTITALNELGEAMVTQDPRPDSSPIPPIHTYWGQFVDHDLTAGTDGSSTITFEAVPLTPTPPADVVVELTNARNPALNLDSVYGDGPFATPNPDPAVIAVPYRPDDRAKLTVGALTRLNGVAGVRIPPVADDERDLPRRADDLRTPEIGDARNDENLVIAQLHVAFLRFHNNAVDWVRDNEPERTGVGAVFARARELTRWAYQWACVQDYLTTVLHPGTVDEVLASEDDLLDLAGRGTYMPLEFSVAAFRFGHSMIRGAYDWNRNFGVPGIVQDVGTLEQLFQFTGKGRFRGAPTLPDNWPAEWARFVGTDDPLPARFARPIDTFLAGPLQNLTNEIGGGAPASQLEELLIHLARRNLLRGFLLSIPTGQAMADALGIPPLTEQQMIDGIDPALLEALDKGGFRNRTPLWFYVLRESEVHDEGHTLGRLGSRIVAETIIGQLRHDPRSYLNQSGWTPAAGVRLPDGSPVTSIATFLRFAGVL